jgi:dihydroorotase
MKSARVLFFVVTAFAQEVQYDLILKGGHVIDPKNGVDAVRDVAIRGGKIAAVAANLAPAPRRRPSTLPAFT